MIRKNASLIIAIALVALVATACIVRTGPPRRTTYRSEPVRGEKHKPKKHKDNGKHRGHDRH